MKHSADNKEQEDTTMKHTVITALSLILVMFLAGCQIHAGQWQSLIQEGIHAEGRNEDGNSVLIQPASSPKPVKATCLEFKLGPAVHGMQVTSATALSNASQVSDESCAKLPFKSGDIRHGIDGTGETDPAVGAENRHARIVWAFLVPEADPGINRAADYENTAVVHAPVASGADVSPCDRNDETVLMTDGATGYQEPPSVPPLTGTEPSVPSPYG